MQTCEVCGIDDDKAFAVEIDGQTLVFDSCECAIHALAPTCAHCGCKVVGHGVEHAGQMYCSDRCAGDEGVAGLNELAYASP